MNENNNIPNMDAPTGGPSNLNFQIQKPKKGFNALIIPMVIMGIVLIIAVILIFNFKNKYEYQKSEVDQITETAVTQAKKEQKAELDKQYEEESKSPYLTYTGPSELGSVKIVYPKNWSVYYNQGNSRSIFDFYAHPVAVPATDLDKKYALRVAITSDKYQDALEDYEKQTKNKNITISPYQVSGVTGARIDGEIDKDIDGSLVVFPVRDKVLYVWTQDKTYINDFNDVVLKNLSFIP